MRSCGLTCADAYAHNNAPKEDPAIDVPGVVCVVTFANGDAI